ncbi:MAG: NAD(P)-dependent oxidoreductase [Rhodospirillales bacterium]|nr:NAD(P)-dependent oxidoreductase [Rhodospirillales bacterium]
MAKVGFLGAGVMGAEMALRLLQAGHEVAVYNRSPQKLSSLLKAGARQAASPAEAATGCDMVISMVGDDEASRAVWLGPNGALEAAMASNAILVESSTLSRAWILDLDRLAASKGLRFLDCPVTGGPDGARAGQLTLLLGGDRDAVTDAMTVLTAYSDKSFYFGPVGMGTSYKLIVNMMGAVQAVAAAEGLLVAEKLGLDLDVVAKALGEGAVASPLVKYIVTRMVKADHQDVYFSARWRHKDAVYALGQSTAAGQATPVSEATCKVFQTVLDRGWGDLNSSIVIEALR